MSIRRRIVRVRHFVIRAFMDGYRNPGSRSIGRWQ